MLESTSSVASILPNMSEDKSQQREKVMEKAPRLREEPDKTDLEVLRPEVVALVGLSNRALQHDSGNVRVPVDGLQRHETLPVSGD